MVINHNISALETVNTLSKNTSAEESSLQKLSTGSKINSAADDASGLAISQKMQAQINGLDQADENVSNGTSLLQTAEGALGNVQDILQKMRTLAVEANNDTQNSTDKSNLQDQANELANEINRIAQQTSFNTKSVFSGNSTAGVDLFNTTGLSIQIGADSGQVIALSLANTATAVAGTSLTGVFAFNLGVEGGKVHSNSYTSVTAISLKLTNTINTIQSAIDAVSKLRSKLGAYENRLSYAGDTLESESENLTSAQSTISDTDVAEEMTNYTKENILVQSAESMLAQANQLPEGMLTLLKS